MLDASNAEALCYLHEHCPVFNVDDLIRQHLGNVQGNTIDVLIIAQFQQEPLGDVEPDCLVGIGRLDLVLQYSFQNLL